MFWGLVLDTPYVVTPLFWGLVLHTPYVATTYVLRTCVRHTLCRHNFMFWGLLLDTSYVVTVYVLRTCVRQPLCRHNLCFEDLCKTHSMSPQLYVICRSTCMQYGCFADTLKNLWIMWLCSSERENTQSNLRLLKIMNPEIRLIIYKVVSVRHT
jgi:hypothetical protein